MKSAIATTIPFNVGEWLRLTGGPRPLDEERAKGWDYIDKVIAQSADPSDPLSFFDSKSFDKDRKDPKEC